MLATSLGVRPGLIPLGRARAYQVREVEVRVLPDRLRELLDDRGITISELARQIGVTPSAVTNWLSGVRATPVEAVVAIEVVLDVPVEAFCHVRSAR